MNIDWDVVAVAAWAGGASWLAWEYRRRWQAALKREAEREAIANASSKFEDAARWLWDRLSLVGPCDNPNCPEHGEQVRAAAAKATVN